MNSTSVFLVAQQRLELEREAQVISDERVASQLQRDEDLKKKGFQEDYELARRLEVLI